MTACLCLPLCDSGSEGEDGRKPHAQTDISHWPRLSNRHQSTQCTLPVPTSHPRALYVVHNGNPNTQERFLHANVKSIQGDGKYAIGDSSRAQRKQYAVKCLHCRPRQPPAFQLRCQHYINMTNTGGCDLSLRAEPTLTSGLWSVWVDKHNCDCLNKRVRSGNSYSPIHEVKKQLFFSSLLLFFFLLSHFKNVQFKLAENPILANEISGRSSVIISNHRVGLCLDWLFRLSVCR